MAIYIGDPDSVLAQLDVIRVLIRRGEPAPRRSFIVDTPWVQVRWANPRYL